MKTIPNFPDYQITKDGRVWSKPRKDTLGHNLKGKWLKSKVNIYGYCEVVLTVNSRKYSCKIHRLVLETYIGSCPKGMQCRHLNGIRTDNRLINLCWGTCKENKQDSIKHETSTQGEKVGTSKLTDDKVRVIRYLRNVAKFSLKDIAWQFDVTIATIGYICTGKTWKHLLNNAKV